MRFLRIVPILALGVALAACDRARAPTPDAQSAVAPATAVDLQDVVETRPDYIVGISYPESAADHPALALALKAYADAARGELMRAVAGLKGQKPTAPYDLSLQFTGLVDTPQVVAVAADGSTYTGGAHGQPLVARFVWLPQQQAMLKAEQLIADATGWQAISDASREQLMTGLAQHLDADEVEGADRAAQLTSGSGMIDAGTEPVAANFAQFEPVMNAEGQIRAIRFVFPPDRVAPYVEGTRTVEIPARILLPHVAPAYRKLFQGG
ncbi:MAG: DUF3298 domain-containing protein [Lysobacteraceae bacterium]|nr:MAG: DUF3298 domain-containing protein [Xanthomonadaceae bacterium]